jgi:hypothetical protein
MAVEETIKIQADVKDAVKKISDLTKAVEDLTKQNEEQQKQLESSMKSSTKAAKQQAGAINNIKKSVDKAKKGFKGFGLVLKGLGFGILIKLGAKMFDMFQQNQQVVEIFNGVAETLSIILKQIFDIITPMIQRINEATGGFDALQKVIGGVLSIAVNNIVLAFQLVAAGIKNAQIAWEKSWFGGNDPERIKELKGELGEIKESIGETTNRIIDSGKQIGENFIEAVGEVGTAAQGIVEGVSEVVEKVDVQTAIAQGKALARTAKNFELAALQQQRLVEEYDRAAEELRQIRDDESISIEERIEANEKLGDVLNDQIEAEKSTVQARIDALQEEIDLKGASVERTNELFSLNTELAAIDAKVAGFKSEQLVNQNALIKEQNELKQSQLETDTTLNLEQARFLVEQETNEIKRLEMLRVVLEQEKEIELERLQNKIDTYALGTQARIDAENEFAVRKQELDQEVASNENAINALKSKNEIDWANLTEEEKMQIVSQGFKNLATVLGEESAAGKAAAIAGATIDTYQSATASYKSLAGIPIIGPVLGAAAAGAAIASGLATVKKITATKTPGGKSSAAPSISAPGRQAPASAPPAFNVVGASGANQLADVIAESEKKPVKAFVVSNDVSTAQELDRNIVEGASI